MRVTQEQLLDAVYTKEKQALFDGKTLFIDEDSCDLDALALEILKGWLPESEKLQGIIEHYDGLNPDNILSELLKEGIKAIEGQEKREVNNSNFTPVLDTVDKVNAFIEEVNSIADELNKNQATLSIFTIETPEFQADVEAKGLRRAIFGMLNRHTKQERERKFIELSLRLLQRAFNVAGEIREELEAREDDKIPPEIKTYIDRRLGKANDSTPPFLDDDIF